jgi:hypothetical protein
MRSDGIPVDAALQHAIVLVGHFVVAHVAIIILNRMSSGGTVEMSDYATVPLSAFPLNLHSA